MFPYYNLRDKAEAKELNYSNDEMLLCHGDSNTPSLKRPVFAGLKAIKE